MSAVRAHGTGTGTMTNPWHSSPLKTPKRAAPSALCSSPPQATPPHPGPSVIAGLVFYSLLPLPQHLRRTLQAASIYRLHIRRPSGVKPDTLEARKASNPRCLSLACTRPAERHALSAHSPSARPMRTRRDHDDIAYSWAFMSGQDSRRDAQV
ncbi:hypothetical protein C8R45DRAFT_974165, partial [Mycena sanguinolenta]